MSIRPTVQVGDPCIRAKSRAVTDVRARQVRKVLGDLTDSMRATDLVGMAAPQLGVALRIFVTEIRKTKFRKDVRDLDMLRVFINPRIIKKSTKKVLGYEGCGSVAHSDLFGLVPRAESVTVAALDENGFTFKLSAKGLLARVIQHEMDHLNGVVFVDHVTDTRSYMTATRKRTSKA